VALRNAALIGELAGAVTARDRLLSVAAHELRTPLTPLSLQVELLLRGLAEHRSAESLQGTAERIRAYVRRATELLGDLLDADRLARGAAAGALVAVDLAALAREVAGARQCPAPVVAAAAAPVLAAADPGRLRLAVESLVACVARLADGRVVSLRADEDGHAARLSITAAPPGPPAEGGERHHGGGLELGLWAVRQLVEAQGGTVGLAAGRGRAPAFTIRLPRFLEAGRAADRPASPGR
jgi:signal transduction histidine kinase